MKITYQTPAAFYDAIEALVQRGLTFEADGENFRITLTGGF